MRDHVAVIKPVERRRRLTSSAEWRFLGVLSRAAPGLAAAWWALIISRGVLPAVFTIAIGVLVGEVQQHRPLTQTLLIAGGAFVAINVLGPLHDAVAGDLGARAGAWLNDRLMLAAARPPGIGHLERPDLSDRLATARNFELGMGMPPLATAMPRIGSGFAEIVGGLAQAVVLARYTWWAPILVGGAWASTHLLLRDSSSWKVYHAEAVIQEQRHATYGYRLAIDPPAAKEIRLFGLAAWMVGQVAGSRRRLVDAIIREQRLRRGPVWLGLTLIAASNALLFWSLARDASSGSLGLAALIIFAQASVGVSSLAFGDFDWWFRGSAQPIPAVLDLDLSMAAAGALAAGAKDPAAMPVREIRFTGVRFGYGSGPPVLDGFDLVVPAGASLAIVGPNGAGKTTLAKLICRLYDPDAGAVLVDGVDLRQLEIGAWRSRLAAVFQDFIRYELPLRDNVAPGGAPDGQVRSALETADGAGLAELGTILSRSYEGGTDLSGGQWQRVALARALCSVQLGAGVVILDEPTAQLDVRGEAEIFDRILKATRGRTTILVSHRFSTVRHADRICVMDGGRVVEQGTHDELMAGGGRYRTMFDLQAARFLDGQADEVDVTAL